METEQFIVTEEDVNIRIDKVVNKSFASLSRSYIQKLIKEDSILVNKEPVKSNYCVRLGDLIEVNVPTSVEMECNPEDIPLVILYEDEDVIVIDKPKGMVVHPAPGHYTGTLVNALLYHCKSSLSGINGVTRPGIVHRIDKDTTGSIIACKNDLSHEKIAAQLEAHSIVRKYQAIVHGTFKTTEGIIDLPIGRSTIDRKKMSVKAKNPKPAVTHYKVLETFNGYSYIECVLETGRTHQIRVHMAAIGHPILGDEVYGQKERNLFSTQGQVLHAATLGFIHPRTGQYIETNANLPSYFIEILDKMRTT